MSHPGAEGSLELLLRKLLLGEELVNTEFHLYSTRSFSSGLITKPRVLCANNDLLSKGSKYFADLLSSDIDSSDPSLRELTDDNDVPSECRIDDYGYGSDSDLEEYEDPASEISEAQSRTLIPPSFNDGAETASNDGEDSSDDKSDSDASDTFFMSSDRSSTIDQILEGKDAINDTSAKEISNNITLAARSALRLRSSKSRHVLVKDTAFQTWYTLLNYLSTGEALFLPLRSATSGRPGKSSSAASSLDKPRCSPKSMYRLACKVGLDNLRNQALACIRSNLTEHNILKEISCSLVARHQQLLEMELDVLYSCIASPSVVAAFPAFVQSIINKELPHGALVLLDVHRRFLRELHPLSSVVPVPPNGPNPSPGALPIPHFPEPVPCNSFDPSTFDPPSVGPCPAGPLSIESSPLRLNPIELRTPVESHPFGLPQASFGSWGMPATSVAFETGIVQQDEMGGEEIECLSLPSRKKLKEPCGGKKKQKK